MQMSVRADVDAVKRMLTNVQREQMPFATAAALSDTVKDIRTQVQADIPSQFNLRRPWIVQGIRFTPATKQELTASVYSKDPFMALQQTGGTKTSIGRRVFDYGNYLAIPLDARTSKSDIVRKEDWPANLVEPFVFTAHDGRRYLAVHALGGKKGPQSVKTARGKQKRSTGLRLMYVLVPKAEYHKRFTLVETGLRLAPERFPMHLSERLAQALATAR
jgi:hypothetical protein